MHHFGKGAQTFDNEGSFSKRAQNFSELAHSFVEINHIVVRGLHHFGKGAQNVSELAQI